MDYLNKAVVDIAKALFKTSFTIWRILTRCYALILRDIVDEGEFKRMCEFRETFLKVMLELKNDQVDYQDGGILFQEEYFMAIDESQLNS